MSPSPPTWPLSSGQLVGQVEAVTHEHPAPHSQLPIWSTGWSDKRICRNAKSELGSRSKATLRGFHVKNKPGKSRRSEASSSLPLAPNSGVEIRRFHFSEAGGALLGWKGNLTHPKAVSFGRKKPLAWRDFYFIYFPRGWGKGAGPGFMSLTLFFTRALQVPGPMVAPSALLRATLPSHPEMRASRRPAPSRTVAISHMRPLSTWNVASPN